MGGRKIWRGRGCTILTREDLQTSFVFLLVIILLLGCHNSNWDNHQIYHCHYFQGVAFLGGGVFFLELNSGCIKLTPHLDYNGDRVLSCTVVPQTCIIPRITHINCIDNQVSVAANSNATTGCYFVAPLVPWNLRPWCTVGSAEDCDSLTSIDNHLLLVYIHWWWNWKVKISFVS